MPRNAATQNNNTENMEQQVPFKVTITEHDPERGVLANADVNVAGIMTILSSVRLFEPALCRLFEADFATK